MLLSLQSDWQQELTGLELVNPNNPYNRTLTTLSSNDVLYPSLERLFLFTNRRCPIMSPVLAVLDGMFSVYCTCGMR